MASLPPKSRDVLAAGEIVVQSFGLAYFDEVKDKVKLAGFEFIDCSMLLHARTASTMKPDLTKRNGMHPDVCKYVYERPGTYQLEKSAIDCAIEHGAEAVVCKRGRVLSPLRR